jgi:ankyrin repeat protein
MIMIMTVQDSHGHTALSKAAAMGEISVCKILLENGASVNSMDQEGRSPAYHAAINLQEDTLSLILAQGGSINSAVSRAFICFAYYLLIPQM